ncbi:MAG: TldD/PmbA family protein [Ruminococcaceae bacterium]|nr:TldD/PmbA family protein [Oscillospiraceae bacterium]
MLRDLISDKTACFADGVHTELRAQTNLTRGVSMMNGNLTGNVRNENTGVSARVYADGVYGFSSTAEYSDEAVKAVLKAASENAAFMAAHAGKNKSMLPALPCGSVSTAYDLNDPEQRTYIDFAKALDAYIEAHCPKLLARVISVRADSMEKRIAVSNGCHSHSVMPRSYVYVFMTAATPEGKPVELYEVMGGYGTFDQNFKDVSDCYEAVDRLYLRILEKACGVYAEAGEKTVILGGILPGMLAHEAVGHTVEADLVLGGSVAGYNLNKQVASELVSLTDYAHTAFGSKVPLPIYVDDEGTKAEDALIIEKGILRGYMNNRESAEHFGVSPCGNARAYLFSDEPLIRMRNTCILPGTSKLEEMIASVEDGYYFLDTNNGQADTTGEFMFGVTGGYEIKNGKLGRPILDTTISGVAFEMLKTVDMVSDEVVWASSGMCGKKQPMPVGMGGPALRCKVTVGGK